MRFIRWTAAAAVVLVPFSAAFAAAHVDEELGFSFQVPNGWTQIPIPSEEAYVVAKYLSDREYVDKEGWSFRPEMKVILFDPRGKRTVEVRKEDENVTRLTEKNPYKSYPDFLKSDGQGGRYISREDAIKVNGVETTWFEAKFEKLTVARRGIAFVYHASDIDYCLTTEILEQNWEKHSPAIVNAFKSFKVFQRKGSVKRETTGEDDVVFVGDIDKLPPAERAARKQQAFDKAVRISQERLPDGWTVKRSKNYVAFSHADDKFTTRVLDQAEAVRAWADANCDWFGDGIPSPQILRICKDWDEERAFSDTTSRSGYWATREITLSRRSGISELRSVSGEVFRRWLDDKNPRLSWWSMPPWLGNGLTAWVQSGTAKGGKLEFAPDGPLAQSLKLASKSKCLISPREIITMTGEEMDERSKQDVEWWDNPKGWNTPSTGATSQASGFVRYLLAGPGKSAPKTKDLLRTYAQALDAKVREADEKKPKMREEAKTEEEEDARMKERQSDWKKREKDLLAAVFDAVFAGWTDADWTALEKSYAAFAR
jgi:hypothetical protein